MGTIFEYQGRYGAALKSKEDALKTFRELKDRSFWMAEILSGYGHSLSQVGQYDEAQKILGEALSLARELQNKTLIAQTLNFHGDAFYYRGDLKSAEGFFSQALAASSGDVEKEVVLLSKFDTAKCEVAEKRYQAAIAPLKAVVRDADASGLKYLSTAAQLELAEALIGTRQYPAARKELDASMEACQKLGLRSLLARSDYLLGRTLELTGNRTEASSHYADARRILDEIRKESGSDAILKRQDLAAISSQSTGKP
jgi:tetratricopeptide (TPR) repeat protein